MIFPISTGTMRLSKKTARLLALLLIAVTVCFPLTSCGDDEDPDPITIDVSDYIYLTHRPWHATVTETGEGGSTTTYTVTLDFLLNGVESDIQLESYGQGGVGSATMYGPKYSYKMDMDNKTLTFYDTDDTPRHIFSYQITETTLVLSLVEGDTYPLSGHNVFRTVTYSNQ